MGLRPVERVVIVTDRPEIEVGAALRRSAEKVTGPANVKLFVLEVSDPSACYYSASGDCGCGA